MVRVIIQISEINRIYSMLTEMRNYANLSLENLKQSYLMVSPSIDGRIILEK
jgi:hypothetical protein